MITTVLAWTAGIAFAAGMVVGGWIGADWYGTKREAQGFAAGVADERSRDEEKMKTLTARLQAEGLALQLKESARARELDRIKDAAREVARVTLTEELGDSRAELARVLARVRDAEARRPLRGSNRPDRMPQSCDAPAGAEGSAAAGSLSGGDREAAVRLADEADKVSSQYRACLSLFPKVSPP